MNSIIDQQRDNKDFGITSWWIDWDQFMFKKAWYESREQGMFAPEYIKDQIFKDKLKELGLYDYYLGKKYGVDNIERIKKITYTRADNIGYH